MPDRINLGHNAVKLLDQNYCKLWNEPASDPLPNPVTGVTIPATARISCFLINSYYTYHAFVKYIIYETIIQTTNTRLGL